MKLWHPISRLWLLVETLAQLDPANSQWQQDLSVSYGNIGDIQQKLGQINAALVSYQQFLSIHETLTQLDPANSKWQRGLVGLL